MLGIRVRRASPKGQKIYRLFVQYAGIHTRAYINDILFIIR